MLELLLGPVIAPAVVTGILCLIAGRLGSDRAAAALAGLGLALSVVAAFLVLKGMPPLPPVAAGQKVFVCAVLGGLLVAVCALATGLSSVVSTVSLIGAAGGVYWIAERYIGRADTMDWITLGAYAAAMLAAFWSVGFGSGPAPAARARLGVASAGLAGVCMLSGNTILGFSAIALAVGFAASMLAEGRRSGALAGAAITCAGFIVFSLLAAQTALFGRIDPLPLVLVALIAPLGGLAELAGWRADTRGLAFLATIKLAMPPAVIAGAAIAASYYTGGGSPYG
ncbi:MAG: hypothetical protein RIM72_04245 [Alphaproteobacteria bacterium]